MKLAQKKIVEKEVERYKRKEGPKKNWKHDIKKKRRKVSILIGPHMDRLDRGGSAIKN